MDDRPALLLADGATLVGGAAADLGFDDVEPGDTFECLAGDRCGTSSGELVEAPAHMGPAERPVQRHRARPGPDSRHNRRPRGCRQNPRGGRSAVWPFDWERRHRRRRVRAAPGPVVAGIGPELAGLGAAASGMEHRGGLVCKSFGDCFSLASSHSCTGRNRKAAPDQSARVERPRSRP